MKRLLSLLSGLLLGCSIIINPLLAVEEGGQDEGGVPSSRLYLASLNIVRYNPLGLDSQNRLMYSIRLFESSSDLFRDTFIALGPTFKINPAIIKVGGIIEFQPMTILNFRFGYEFVNYFGTFGYLQSYASNDVDFSDDTQSDNKDDAYSTNGHHYYIEPTFQLKIGFLAMRTKFSLEYWVNDLHNGDDYFYDATLDTLVPVRELVWSNDTDFLYINGRLIIGARFSYVDPGSDLNHMRVGPLIAWSFNTDKYTSFNRPTLLCILGWYLDHPNRIGPVPYVLVGFSFSSDFL